MNSIMNQMTKSELIAWINQNCFLNKPKLSWVLYERWEAKSKDNQKKREKNLSELSKIDCKERDRLAILFNSSKCSDERLKLAIKIEATDKLVRDNMKKGSDLHREYEQIQKLYDKASALMERGE